jgi:hypothetical protein
MQRNVISHAVTYGRETRSLKRNTMFDNRVLKGRHELQARRSDNMMNDELHNFHSSNN